MNRRAARLIRLSTWPRATVGGLTRRAATAVEVDPAWYLSWAAVAALASAALLRLAQTLMIRPGSALSSWIAVAPGLALAAGCIATLVWAYWQVRVDGRGRHHYAVALWAAIATIGISTEAFAGLTTVLGQQGVLSTARPDAPGLWTVERYYLWHLVDAVPLLEAPETMRWARPHLFDDHWSGALLLVFKVLVIVPLVRVAMAGYQLGLTALAALLAKLQENGEGDGRAPDVGVTADTSAPSPFSTYAAFAAEPWAVAKVWAVVGSLVGVTLVGVGALVFVIEPSSVVHGWLAPLSADGIDVLERHVGLAWLPDAADGVAAACVAFIAFWSIAALVVITEETSVLRSRLGVAGTLLAAMLTLAPAVVTGAAVSLALLHVGWADAQPSIQSREQAGAAVNWYAWHLADTIPVLDIPDSLNWTTRVEFVDRWSGTLLLIAKILLVVILVGPVASLVRMAIERRSRLRLRGGTLAAARRFRELLLETETQLGYFSGPHAASAGTDPRIGIRRILRRLDEELPNVRALFGESSVTDAAEAAVSRAPGIRNVIDQAWMASVETNALPNPILESLKRARLAAATRRAAYETAMAVALSDKAASAPARDSGAR